MIGPLLLGLRGGKKENQFRRSHILSDFFSHLGESKNHKLAEEIFFNLKHTTFSLFVDLDFQEIYFLDITLFCFCC